MRFTTLSRTICASALVALLTACGGGGGNAGNSPFPNATAPAADGGHAPIFTLSSSALALSTTTGTSTAQTFTVSEPGYGGAFNGVIACTPNPSGQTGATNQFVAAFSTDGSQLTETETPAAPGDPVTFSVYPGAWTGSCTVTITDANNNTTAVTVTVSATNVVVFGKQRK